MSHDYWDDSKYEALYHIPIESLGLSESAIQIMKRTGITSVGDCVDWHVRALSLTTGSTPVGLIEIMMTEVKQRLEEHGYWPLNTLRETLEE